MGQTSQGNQNASHEQSASPLNDGGSFDCSPNAAAAQVDIKRSQTKHRYDHIVACQTCDVQKEDAGDPKRRGDRQTHHQQPGHGQQTAAPNPKQPACHADGQGEGEQPHGNRLETVLKQPDTSQTKHTRQQQWVQRHIAVVALLHVIEAGKQIRAKDPLGSKLPTCRGLPGFVLVHRRRHGEMAQRDAPKQQEQPQQNKLSLPRPVHEYPPGQASGAAPRPTSPTVPAPHRRAGKPTTTTSPPPGADGCRAAARPSAPSR